MNLSPSTRTVALITGAASGIGKAIAEQLAAEGCALVLTDIQEGALRQVARTLDASESVVLAVPGDVTQAADQQKIIAAAQEHFGRVDVLINNAGMNLEDRWWWQYDDPLAVVRLNLEAPIALTKLVLPGMLERKHGHIINISSIGARIAIHSMYSASKAGVRAFSHGLRRELHGTGVHATAIVPGFVRTALTANNDFPMPGPEVIAHAVSSAMKHPWRTEIVAPRAYHLLVMLDRTLPGFADAIVPGLLPQVPRQ